MCSYRQIAWPTTPCVCLQAQRIQRRGPSKCYAPTWEAQDVGFSHQRQKRQYAPVTNANMRLNAAADSSSGPSRPTINIETVWTEFCSAYDKMTVPMTGLLGYPVWPSIPDMGRCLVRPRMITQPERTSRII